MAQGFTDKGFTAATSSDADAIHDNVSGEISAVTDKAIPVDADFILIEDSENSDVKKSITIANLLAGGVVVIDDLADVDTTSETPADQDHLVWTSEGVSIKLPVDSMGGNINNPSNANDNNFSTYTTTGDRMLNQTYYLSIDLGVTTTYNVTRLQLHQLNSPRYTDIASVHWSDNGSSWTLIKQYSGLTVGDMTLDLEGVFQHRYYKIQEDTQRNEFWRIYEAEVYGYEETGSWVPVALSWGDWIAVDGGVGFENSWVDEGTAGNQDAEYRKHSDGRVELRGLVKTGSVPSTIFTLPTGYRPVAKQFLATYSNALFGAVEIDTDGTVDGAVGSSTTFSLDNISFDSTGGS